MKVSELEGALLDYWVARAEGFAAEICRDEKGSFCIRTKRYAVDGQFRGPFFPSTEWADGGPIVAREGISVLRWEIPADDGMLWTARNLTATVHERGFAPLVAAMRAFVASKFGGEVADVGSIPTREPN